MDKLEQIESLVNAVLEGSDRLVGTHYVCCYHSHAPCLAAYVKDILKGRA